MAPVTWLCLQPPSNGWRRSPATNLGGVSAAVLDRTARARTGRQTVENDPSALEHGRALHSPRGIQRTEQPSTRGEAR